MSYFISWSTSRVGKVLEIAEPEKIDLFKSAKNSGKPDLPMGVFYL